MYFDNSDDATNCDYEGVYLKTDEDDKVLDMCYSEGKPVSYTHLLEEVSRTL